MAVSLVWITPEAEKLIAHCARVSNPDNQSNDKYEGLLNYCKNHGHWSVFEMASACIEINAPRDITRQILRHRSFSFQEFSQRYAEVDKLPFSGYREARMQDTKNRQNSIAVANNPLEAEWVERQETVAHTIETFYKWALKNGMAKECARVILPEGLTPSRVYMSGTIRSWMHYLQVRCRYGETQKEHADIAHQILKLLQYHLPIIGSTLLEDIENQSR